MDKVVDYKVLHGELEFRVGEEPFIIDVKFEKRVNKEREKGWYPLGGISIYSFFRKCFISQAMVKYGNSELIDPNPELKL